MNSGKQVFPDGNQSASGTRRRPQVWMHTANPAVDSGDQGTYSVQKGDWVLREDGSNEIESLWICTVAPAESTDAVFVEVIS